LPNVAVRQTGAIRLERGRSVLPIDHNKHQGEYGEALVRVLATAAGLMVAKPEPDYDGIDFFLRYPGARGTPYRPQIDVQVKSTRSPEGSATHWRYRLEAKHFNQLAGVYEDVPRFLILVIVPPDLAGYTAVDEHNLRLHHAGYWVSLHDHEPNWEIPVSQKVGVDIPKVNLLTVESLLGLMVRPGVQVGSS